MDTQFESPARNIFFNHQVPKALIVTTPIKKVKRSILSTF